MTHCHFGLIADSVLRGAKGIGVRSQQRGSCRLIRAAATKPSAFSRLRFSCGHVKRDGLFPALFPRSRARRLRQTEINFQDAKLSPEPRNHDETDYGKIIEKADRCRDALQYAEAAEAYGAALELAPFRTDIRVQHGNMLKEMGRLAEAEAAYREALARVPDDADIHLQLGHALKLQGRRAAALEAYTRAAALAPFAVAPKQELFHLGDRPTQEQLYEAQLRLGSVEALMALTQSVMELRNTADRIQHSLGRWGQRT
jgi:tetratricopeptide (TPR) repeat protein